MSSLPATWPRVISHASSVSSSLHRAQASDISRIVFRCDAAGKAQMSQGDLGVGSDRWHSLAIINGTLQAFFFRGGGSAGGGTKIPCLAGSADRHLHTA